MQAEFRCLAIENAAGRGSIALGGAEDCIERALPAAAQGSRPVFLTIEALLAEAGWRLATLDCIGFGCGPGAFTGLRVAAAVTQALAYGAGLPVCRVSSLATLAAGALRLGVAGPIAACLDARMGEVYAACYAAETGGLSLLAPEQVLSPARFDLPGRARYAAVGPGWAACPELERRLAARLSEVRPELLPAARDLLPLAAQAWREGRLLTAADALPNYLRDKVAG